LATQQWEVYGAVKQFELRDGSGCLWATLKLGTAGPAIISNRQDDASVRHCPPLYQHDSKGEKLWVTNVQGGIAFCGSNGEIRGRIARRAGRIDELNIDDQSSAFQSSAGLYVVLSDEPGSL